MHHLPTYVFFVILIFNDCHSVSIGTVSDQNVDAKNETEKKYKSEFFPDWVPFKNKEGDELGEFVQVTKPKPKKRLALPKNFILRAVAEPEGEDYYERGQGASNDDYDNKDWSDVSRSAGPAPKENKPTLSHNDLSDIEGVVNIIKKTEPNKIKLIKDIGKRYKVDRISREDAKASESSKSEEDQKANEYISAEELDETTTKRTAEKHKDGKDKKSVNEDEEYDDTTGNEKSKTLPDDEVENDSEVRKTNILDSVDELKERHAQEQKVISEKSKDDLRYAEDMERDSMAAKDSPEKYRLQKPKPTIEMADYVDYFESDARVDKYKPQPKLKVLTTTEEPEPYVPHVKAKPKPQNILKDKTRESVQQVSVFKHPNLFMMYDDEEAAGDEPNKRNNNSSRYTSTTPEDDSERISFVPGTDSNSGEPTLFFPKKSKNKRRRVKTTSTTERTTTSTSRKPSRKRLRPAPVEKVPDSKEIQSTGSGENITAPDATAADSVPAVANTAHGFTSPSAFATTGTASAPEPNSAEISASGPESPLFSGPSATENNKTEKKSVSRETTATGQDSTEVTGTGDLTAKDSAVEVATDTLVASSDHKKEEGGDHAYKKGGGKEYHSEDEEEHGEHGKKAYEGLHKDTKTTKGHHDKEHHHGKYHDHGGHDKSSHEESGHFGNHHHEEAGKKHAKYEESGKHSKGHSTKGSHDIHKKEEYEKKVEFFEEDGDSGEEEKHGGYNNEKEHASRGTFKNGDHKSHHQAHLKGESGLFEKGGHGSGHKGHKTAGGHDSHGKRGQAGFSKEGKESGKKWMYHHGFPAKTANLVIIDRRADRLNFGNPYFISN